jgi:hypothetical protein
LVGLLKAVPRVLLVVIALLIIFPGCGAEEKKEIDTTDNTVDAAEVESHERVEGRPKL